jgi:hypothetical protein
VSPSDARQHTGNPPYSVVFDAEDLTGDGFGGAPCGPPQRVGCMVTDQFRDLVWGPSDCLLNRHALWHAVVVLRDHVNHRPLSRITAAAAHIALTLAARRSTQPADVTFRNGLLMTATQSHIDEETRGLAATLAHRVDELAQDVASAVRAEVDFYKTPVRWPTTIC